MYVRCAALRFVARSLLCTFYIPLENAYLYVLKLCRTPVTGTGICVRILHVAHSQKQTIGGDTW